MPYIPESRRELLKENHQYAVSEGELNFCLTEIILSWIERKGPSYATYNAVKGVLSCIGDELYRRRIAKYEDAKCIENGDVF